MPVHVKIPTRTAKTATDRSRARNARAARILGGIALDADDARKLDAILARTGETAAAWVRRMIREHAAQQRPGVGRSLTSVVGSPDFRGASSLADCEGRRYRLTPRVQGLPYGMGREIDPEPCGACDACARCCHVLSEVGIPCYHCHAGIFMGRRWWTFWRDEYGRWHGTPREDIDVAELEAERARMRGQSNAPVSTCPACAALARYVRMLAFASIVALDGSGQSGAVGSPRTAIRTHFCTLSMPPASVISCEHEVWLKVDAIGLPSASVFGVPSALIARAVAVITGHPLVSCTLDTACTAMMLPSSKVTAVSPALRPAGCGDVTT